MAVLTAVGGTPKSSTMPPIETGNAATLNDINIWARNRPTIGNQDARSADSVFIVHPLPWRPSCERVRQRC